MSLTFRFWCFCFWKLNTSCSQNSVIFQSPEDCELTPVKVVLASKTCFYVFRWPRNKQRRGTSAYYHHNSCGWTNPGLQIGSQGSPGVALKHHSLATDGRQQFGIMALSFEDVWLKPSWKCPALLVHFHKIVNLARTDGNFFYNLCLGQGLPLDLALFYYIPSFVLIVNILLAGEGERAVLSERKGSHFSVWSFGRIFDCQSSLLLWIIGGGGGEIILNSLRIS